MSNGKRCGRTGKVRFRDDDEAKAALSRIRSDRGERRAKVPVRWYDDCEYCGGVHLTSQEYHNANGTIWEAEDGLHGFHPLPDADRDY